MKVELHPHQKDAIQKMHNGCVLWGGGGTGKTITSLAYAQLKEPKKKIVVVTTAKVRNSFSWEKEAAKLLIRYEDIEVTSWNKIGEFVDREGYFFIFDEQRIVGSGSWVKAFHKVAKKNRWILLSATPGDTWSDYSALFIANGWYKNITDFRRKHAVYSTWTSYPKIIRWLDEPRLESLRKRLLVEMPMIRHTTRDIQYVECEYDADVLDLVRKKRWNVFKDQPIETPAELYGVMRKVVSTDSSRAARLVELMREHPRLIVFYNFDYELEILRRVCGEFSQTWSSTTSGPISKTKSSGNSETRSFTEMDKEIQPRHSDPIPIGVRLDDLMIADPQEHQDFEKWLPPWELTDEELSAALDQWVDQREGETWQTKTERKTPWASKTSTISSQPSDAPSPLGPRSQEMLTKMRRSTPSRSDVLMPEQTAIASASSPDRSEKSLAASTEQKKADAWSGTVWGEDWDASNGTPGPRLERAKYEYEAKHRKESSCQISESTVSSLSSKTSTTSHKSPKDSSARSSSLATSGSTKILPTTDTTSSTETFEWAEYNGHRHQDLPTSDRWVYLVQYQSGAEGWNCIETDTMVFWSLTYSWKLFEQAQCRIDRLNTLFKKLRYFILFADSPAEKPVMAALKEKRDFQPK